jgi:hypothetical protein
MVYTNYCVELSHYSTRILITYQTKPPSHIPINKMGLEDLRNYKTLNCRHSINHNPRGWAHSTPTVTEMPFMCEKLMKQEEG